MRMSLMAKNYSGVIMFCILGALPFLTGNQYYLHLIIMSSILAINALGLNVINGLAGQLSLGQAGFYALGAYCSALLSVRAGIPVFLSIFVATVFAAVIGFLTALPVLRLSGIYLGMSTYGFGKIVYTVVKNWDALTQGTYGLRRIPPLRLLGFAMAGPRASYYVFLAVLLGFVVISTRIQDSPLGKSLVMIREDELAAEHVGINVFSRKVVAFVIGAAFSGCAGGLAAHYLSYISPEHFTHTTSLQIVTMLIVGGPGHVSGAVGGAFLLTLLPEVLRLTPQLRMLLYGILLVTMAVLRPQGVFGGLKTLPSISKGVSALCSRAVQNSVKGSGS